MASLGAIKSVLAQRNTRIFYGCSAFSWTGLWIQQIATDWLAWELTHSALWVGILAFCNLGPSVIVSPFAGAFSDRMDRLKLTVATQLVTAAHAATLVVLTWTGVIRIEHMVVLQIVLGISQSFAQPARQSLVPGMVSRADLPGAVALNSLTYNIARSVGPGIGGVLVATWGVIPGMVVNCCAYLIASVTMPMLRLSPETRRGHPPTGRSVVREAMDGIVYVARHKGMAPLFIYAWLVGILARSVPEMLSPYVAGLWGRGPEGLAILATTMGVAALAGGMFVAMRGRLRGLSKLTLGAGLAMSIGTGLFVATHSFPFAVACALVLGAAGTIHGHFGADAAAERHLRPHAGAGAEPVGHDHPGGAGDRGADVWRGDRICRAAGAGGAGRGTGDAGGGVGPGGSCRGWCGAGARGAGAGHGVVGLPPFRPRRTSRLQRRTRESSRQ